MIFNITFQRKKLYFGFIGIFIGLMIMNNSLRTLLYLNLMHIVFIIVLTSMVLTRHKSISFLSLFKVKLTKIDVLLLVVTLTFCIYAGLTTFLNGLNEYSKLVELLILPLLYVIGRKVNLSIWLAICSTIMIIGVIAAIAVITQRSYVYLSGVNYLLISLGIGLSACVSLLFFNIKKTSRSWYFLAYIICLISLFSVQSRFVFLFVIIYSLICFLCCNFFLKKYFNLFIAFLFFLVIGAYFFDTILSIYNNTQIFNRMSSLFSNFENEPRFETYQLYFNHINDFKYSGYGTGGTYEYVYRAGTLRDTYPHNFFLEFYSEFGVLGLFFSSSIILISIFHLLKNKCLDCHYLAAATFFIFYFFNFMKSFSIYDSSILFLACGVISNKIFIHKRLCK